MTGPGAAAVTPWIGHGFDQWIGQWIGQTIDHTIDRGIEQGRGGA